MWHPARRHGVDEFYGEKVPVFCVRRHAVEELQVGPNMFTVSPLSSNRKPEKTNRGVNLESM